MEKQEEKSKASIPWHTQESSRTEVKEEAEASALHCCLCGTVPKPLTLGESSREEGPSVFSWVLQRAGDNLERVVTLGKQRGEASEVSHLPPSRAPAGSASVESGDKYLLYSSSWTRCNPSKLPLWKTPAKTHSCHRLPSRQTTAATTPFCEDPPLRRVIGRADSVLSSGHGLGFHIPPSPTPNLTHFLQRLLCGAEVEVLNK